MGQWWTRLNTLRLAAFVLGYGLTGALTGGTLNRIMVAEIGLPLWLVGLFFAAPLFVAPLRAWLGHRSDVYPVRGLHREPYILIGAALAGLGVVAAILLLVGIANTILLAVGVMLAFLIHEAGRNLAHNSFQALIADKFSDVQRARAMTLFEIVTLLGLVIGAGGVAGGLREYSVGRLVSVTIGVSIVTFLLTLLAVVRSEPRSSAARASIGEKPFMQVIREIVLGDRVVRRFFVLVLFVVIGTLAQDVLLEPYAAFVLSMDVADTSRLTMFWGLGVMAAMLVSALFLIKRFGEVNVLRIGLAMTIIVFIAVIITGVLQNANLFRVIVLALGVGTGLAGAGLLSSIIHFTTQLRAGVLLGVWGLAMVVGRSLGGLFGGILVDVVLALNGGNYLFAYGVVFALEAILLVSAFVMVPQVNVAQSAAYREASTFNDTAVTGAASLS